MDLKYVQSDEITADKFISEIIADQARSISMSINRLMDRREYFALAEEICGQFGKYDNPSWNDTEERVCCWEMGWGNVKIIFSLGLGKEDSFKDVIKDLAKLFVLRAFTLHSNKVFDSYVERVYKNSEEKFLTFNMYPSKVPNANCIQERVHDLGPEFKLVCDKPDILKGEEVEEFVAEK